MTDDKARALYMSLRQSLLTQVDAIERYLDIHPTTAEMKRQRSGVRMVDGKPSHEVSPDALLDSMGVKLS